MSYSEKDIIKVVGGLLQEINEQYAAIAEDQEHLSPVALGLLAAKAKYVAAHVDLLSQLAAKSVAASSDPEETTSPKPSQAITFTPATALAEEKQAASSEKHDEVAEQPSNKATPAAEETDNAKDASDMPEEKKADTDGAAESQGANEEVDLNEPAQQPESTNDQEEDTTSVSAWRSSASGTAEASSERPRESQQQQQQQQQAPVEKSAQNEEEAVIKAVVEESRTIEVDRPSTPASKEETASQEASPSTSGRPLTLNEMIQQQRRAGLTNANQFKTPASKSEQVVDLKTAVNLNDKLLFIKDLFNGYSLAYTEAIELLNRFDNMAEADAFLQANYALKNNWASKPLTVEKLYHILQKKFA